MFWKKKQDYNLEAIYAEVVDIEARILNGDLIAEANLSSMAQISQDIAVRYIGSGKASDYDLKLAGEICDKVFNVITYNLYRKSGGMLGNNPYE